MLDLFLGHPDPALLPRDALADACVAAAHRFRTGGSEGLPYGSNVAGSERFLDELAAFISRHTAGEKPARADGLLLTGGVSHGIELLCRVLTVPGDVVVVEAPTYFLVVEIFKSHGLEVLTVPVDAEGLVVHELERLLDKRTGPPVKMLYTIPTNHNPTGTTLPESRRRQLVQMARRHNFTVVADEVYHLLDWHAPGERPPRMVCFDDAYCQAERGDAQVGVPTVVVSVNSFTKICAPGLRVGWVEAAPSLVDRIAKLAYLTSGGCVATFTSEALLHHMLTARSADKVLAALVADLRTRSETLHSSLIDSGLQPLVKPTGGYFVWVPLGVDAKALLHRVQVDGLKFMHGGRCDESKSDDSAQCARLCFAYHQPEELAEAAFRLASATAAYRCERSVSH